MPNKLHTCIQCRKEHEYEPTGTHQYFCSVECEKLWDDAYTWSSNTEKLSDDGLECPYCEHLHTDAETIYDDDLDEYVCDSCGRKFQVEVHKTWSWTTSKLRSEYDPKRDAPKEDE